MQNQKTEKNFLDASFASASVFGAFMAPNLLSGYFPKICTEDLSPVPGEPGKIRTYSGIYFDPLTPRIEDINIEDIAHALARICRWGGHTVGFFSVAQHCVLGCQLLETKREKLAFLLHDAVEAYLYDVCSPIKRQMPAYIQAEKNIDLMIRDKYGVGSNIDLWRKVKEADEAMLRWEWAHVMQPTEVVCWSPEAAKYLFLTTFEDLTSQFIK